MAGFTQVCLSLADLVGEQAVRGCCRARAALTGESESSLLPLGLDAVDFYPESLYTRQVSLLERVGDGLVRPAEGTASGASTRAFCTATHAERSPLSGYGWYRVGEDGRLYLASKSEHYHASLGHSFPGYSLIDRARALGIPNATHNNTRGNITRRAEEALVRIANGIPSADREALDACIASADPEPLNCVLNLQTGSLAAEAAVKLALARFYRSDAADDDPPYAGRIPVFVVLGDDEGGLQANYHGTTITTQMMRGLWPDMYAKTEDAGILRVCPVRPNCTEDLDRAFETWNRPPYKIAAFIHEIVMMNYGARRITPDFLHHAYTLCGSCDALTIVDEIQSCVWGEDLFSFREWGLAPSMVVIGKGFPGGEFAGSRILFNKSLDVLPQFGALVTNGQEELTALAYLVTIAWTEANQTEITRIGNAYEEMLKALVRQFPDTLRSFEGCRHLGGLSFNNVEQAKAFAVDLSSNGIDISVQTYKESCPPVALTKLPLTAGEDVVHFLEKRLGDALQALS